MAVFNVYSICTSQKNGVLVFLLMKSRSTKYVGHNRVKNSTLTFTLTFTTVRNQLPGHTTYPVIATFPQQGEGIMRSLWACQKDKNLLYNIVCKL